MKLKISDRALNYLHYIVLILAIIICLYIGYTKFIPTSNEKGSRQTVKTEKVEPKGSDSARVYVPEGHLDSIPGNDLPYQPYSMEDIEDPSAERSEDRTERNVEKNISVKKAKTWMELIIDLLETLTPLLLPVVSYYFKPNAAEET